MLLVQDAMVCLESQNQLMVVHIQNMHEGMKVAEIDAKIISEKMFMGWLFYKKDQLWWSLICCSRMRR